MTQLDIHCSNSIAMKARKGGPEGFGSPLKISQTKPTTHKSTPDHTGEQRVRLKRYARHPSSHNTAVRDHTTGDSVTGVQVSQVTI